MWSDGECPGDRRGIFVDYQRERSQRPFVTCGQGDAHADRNQRGVFRPARRIERDKAGAVLDWTVLEDVPLDAVPGLFRRLIRCRRGGLRIGRP